jgi:DNA-binding transcriptional LysR family regulator
MDIKELRAFRSVVEAGTVTRAAVRLRLTQPAVSRILSALEAELGFKLFDRSKNRLLLTPEGTAFFRETERLLATAEELQDAARDIRDGRLSRLRIVAMPALAHGLLPEALAAFKKTHPRLSVSVDVRRRVEVTRWVAGRQFDLGLAALPVDYPGLSTQKLTSCRAIVAVAKDHPFSKQKTVSLDQLAAESLVGLSADAMIQSKINRLFARRGGVPPLAIDTSSLLAVCHFVASGLGCGIVDPFTAHAARHPGIIFRPLEPSLQLDYGILWEKDQQLSSTLSALCAELAATAARIVQDGSG